MGPESILLQVTRGGREGTYRFTCPTCMDAVEKRADRKIVALLVSAGVDVAGLLDVLGGGYAASRVLEVKKPNLTSRTYSPAGKAAYMVKDLQFVHAEAALHRAAVDQAEMSLATFAAVADAGLGDQDMSVVHQIIRQRAEGLSTATAMSAPA